MKSWDAAFCCCRAPIHSANWIWLTLSLTTIVDVCHPGSDLSCMLLAAFRLLSSLAGSTYLCGGLSAHACSPVLLSASAIYLGSSAPAWTTKEVRSLGLYLSKPRLSTSIFIAPWDRLALCGCSGKTAMRQEKSKGSPAGLRSMLLSHCRPKLRGCF